MAGAGTVKTRLAGENAAWGARVAQAFLLDTLQRLSQVDAHRVLAFAPVEREADFAAIVSNRFDLTPQAAGDLGQRLAVFVDQHLEAGGRAVVVVGTDSPTMPVEYIERSFRPVEERRRGAGTGHGRRLLPDRLRPGPSAFVREHFLEQR